MHDAQLEARIYMQASFKLRTYVYLLCWRDNALRKIKLVSNLMSADDHKTQEIGSNW